MRILVADDYPEVLDQVCSLLSSEFEVIGKAHDGAELVAAAHALRPDIVVTDISMPQMNGIEAGKIILRAGCSRAVVIISVHGTPETVANAFEAGMAAYVLKANAGDDLIPAVRAAIEGEHFISQEIAPD